MSADTIRIEIDDSALFAALTQLDGIMGDTTTGRIAGGSIFNETEIESLKELARDLNYDKSFIFHEFLASNYARRIGFDPFAGKRGGMTFGRGKMSYKQMHTFSQFMKTWENPSNRPGFFQRLLGFQMPALSREQRILLRQFPGGGKMLRGIYNLKRLQRGISAGLTTTEGMTTLAATVLLLYAEFEMLKKKVDARDRAYRDFLGRYDTDMTRQEYLEVRNRSNDWRWRWATQFFGGIRG